MRIIAGEYRGRTLRTASDLSIRPTTDRAKQAIFDVLTNRIELEGIDVLDLFAGSGSLGLEAISRGASKVTFVEKSKKSIGVLEANIATIHCEERCTIYPADVFWFLNNIHRSYDLIFVDPPYRLETIGALPSAIYSSDVVKHGTYVVMEYSRESAIDVFESQYEILKKTFGQTIALILEAKAKPHKTAHT